MTQLLTEAQAADLLALKPDTLRRWRYQGRGPTFVRVGASVRYRITDVERWIAANTVQPRRAS